VLLSGFLMVVAVSGLSACRTSPNVAAYVGDAQVTVAELESAVEERLADPLIAGYAEGGKDEFTRRVLSLLVEEEVYAAAAERYDLEVGNDAVRRRIAELLGDDNPDEVYGSLAERGVGREDVFENVRQQLVRQRIAEAEGKAEGLSEAALQARYAEVRESLAQVEFGYVTVPDQTTADAVLAQLTDDPAAYPALAAQYPGAFTLADLERRSLDQVPGPLAQGIAAAAPGTGFTVPVAETGGIVVAFVSGTVYPPFEEVRADLEREASEAVEQVGAEAVNGVREDLGVTVNPRFGVLDGVDLVPGEGGVVDILDDEEADAVPGVPGN
jgi:hypothetical protein